MYSFDNVSTRPDASGQKLKEYRLDKEETELYIMYKERYKKEYPEYYEFLNESHNIFSESDIGNITMGTDYGFYHQMTNEIIHNKRKHIVEYGPGFTTLLLHRIVQDLDYEVKVFSYEDNKKFYESNKNNGLNPFNTIELVDMDLEIKNELLYCTYLHDLEKHKNVDCVIIDGPGPLRVNDVGYRTITTNADLFEKTFDREISTLIEGRHYSQVFMRTHYKQRQRNITKDDR